jgi:hypothetical protein
MFMRNVCLKALVLALTFVGLVGMALRTEAQNVQTLIQFTNSWQYDQTGRQLPANWMSSAYTPDGQWGPSSPGLLGTEDVPGPYLLHAPIQTPLIISGSVTTYYFRTTFNYAGSLNNVSLIATNLVDDGCAIYLNGLRVGGVRIPAGYTALNAAQFFPGGTEGALEVVTFTNLSALRVGQNLLAVEVHQSANPSSDVMFGLKLISIAPTALTITNQPDSQTVTVGDPVSFSVGVSGGPVTYRWFKDNVLQSSTSNELRITSAQVANAGNYHVVVSNVLGAVTSSTAILTVIADTDGPRMEAAVINNVPTGGGSPFGTNTINVIFNEALNAATARNTNNYQLVSATNSNIRIPIINALYSTALGTLLTVEGTNANWRPSGEYYLIVNNLADIRGNNLAPNSVIGVSIRVTTNLTQMIDRWDFYSTAFFDGTYPEIYRNTTNPWSGTNYVVDTAGGLWGNGSGILYVDPNPPPAQVCAGDTPQTLISFQNDPTLFRRIFTLPAGVSQDVEFQFRFLFDDGIVIYLNGVEIQRRNMPSGPWNEATRATVTVTDFGCVTNLTIKISDVPGLRLHTGRGNVLGTNVLAAAVFQSATPESDTWFGLEMDMVALRTAQAPTNRPPGTPTLVRNLINTPQGRKFVLSWPATNYGYNLQYSTDIMGTPRNWWTNSANWTQVADQANPYTNMIPPTTGPRRFYRLFRETLN